MIPVGEAQALVRAQCAPLPVERVALEAALGRVLAADIASPADLPPFDNSAMDGFALRSHGAVVAAGREFAVRGEQAAGDGRQVAAGEGAWEIMTGARVPEGLDAVVPVEQVEVLARDVHGRPARIRLLAEVPPGQHVRRTGEDIARGAPALAAGSRIGPQHVLLAAGLGIAELPVRQRPRVAVLYTGRELVEDPAQPLRPGQIRNASGPYLAARLAAAGAEVVHRESVPDDADAFRAALARALAAGARLVLGTGAVSMGRYDFVPATLSALGAQTLFHKVAMRPGKPLLFARLPDGALYFGLPGNPVSSAVGLRFFVEPALRALLGLPEEQGWRLPLAHEARKKPGFRMHQKARLRLDGGRVAVELLPGQESFKTRPLLDATAWAVLPAEAAHLPPGSEIEVFPPGHEQGGLFGDRTA
ncbi:gephyrin-like molybdotransferase Glp [Vulcaniibacterium gelatinicum]|uniref:molybdopterin molybdotransferase MoeA n=1 Tax=Vulcaniibacterium gelatinicum TaxID=2598725 RepID=UPI0011CBF021|nr:gephyrin-like molybdotransferase Glp [Vulcaniibacterium gelatinicum]